MATTGPIPGEKLLVYVDGSAILKSTGHTINFEHSTIDITSKDSNASTERMAGLKDWSIDVDFLVAFDAAYGFEEVFDLYNNRTEVSLVWTTKISGDVQFNGGALLSSLSMEAPQYDATTSSASFEATSAISKSNVT